MTNSGDKHRAIVLLAFSLPILSGMLWLHLLLVSSSLTLRFKLSDDILAVFIPLFLAFAALPQLILRGAKIQTSRGLSLFLLSFTLNLAGVFFGIAFIRFIKGT